MNLVVGNLSTSLIMEINGLIIVGEFDKHGTIRGYQPPKIVGICLFGNA